MLLSKRLRYTRTRNKKCNFKSSVGIRNKIKDVHYYLEKTKLIYFDVVNLFRSVFPKEVIETVQVILYHYKTNPVRISEVLHLLETCLSQDYFETITQ